MSKDGGNSILEKKFWAENKHSYFPKICSLDLDFEGKFILCTKWTCVRTTFTLYLLKPANNVM